MCGIAGFVCLRGAEPPPVETLRAMCDTIVHRGPDAEGISHGGGVGLGARRLAIIDLEGGNQPLSNEDGSVELVFNGEIYNYREIQRALRGRGHALRTGSDGEVLAHLWEDRGTDFLAPVNGMFAIALHDRRGRKVVLARDRLGIKPLYVAITPGHVVFGSEIKAILASGLVGRDLDLDALRQFLAWEYVPAPATLFAGIRKLEPGQLMEIDLDTASISTRSYWDVPEPVPPGGGDRDGALSDAEWEDRVEEALARAVRAQLVSDVPLGAFLSGGVDSSLVVAAMGEATTFSIGFDDPSYNELRWSEKAARHLGVEHVTEVIRPDVAGLFDRLMHFMDDPIGDFSIFPTYLVSRLARRGVTVALSGDGGDELFGGYDTYQAESIARRYGRVPALLRSRVIEPGIGALRPRPAKKGLVNKARRFVEGFHHDPGLGHARWRLFAHDELFGRLFTPSAQEGMKVPTGRHVLELFERCRSRSRVDQLLYVDLKSYLSDNCLVKVDRMSMACSLEARVPLLDHELVELAFRVPDRLKLRRGRTKVLLKRLAATKVPAECVYRPKEGFSIPIKNWLTTSLEPLMMDLLDGAGLAEGGIFEPGAVQGLVDEHLAGTHNHSHLLWSLMVFQDWKRRWGR